MKRRARLALALAALGLVACGKSLVPSLVQLLANPAKWENETIQVSGFLESGRLFLSSEHARHHDHASSIGIVDRTDDGTIIRDCSGGFGIVDATLRRTSEAPMFGNDPVFFELDDVSRILISQNVENRRLRECGQSS